MAAAIPTIEPLSFRVGETVQWTKSVVDYVYSDGWRLTYYLTGPSTLTVSTEADDDGRGYAATIAATATASLPTGRYWIEGRLTYAGDDADYTGHVYTKYASHVDILPNLATVGAGYDGRSSVRKIRDALQSMVEGTASHPEIAFQLFGDRSWQLVPLKERLDALARYNGLVAEEEKAERLARGERTGVFIRFRSAR